MCDLRPAGEKVLRRYGERECWVKGTTGAKALGGDERGPIQEDLSPKQEGEASGGSLGGE